MDGNIDTVREALIGSRFIIEKFTMGTHPALKKIDEAIAAISAIDPEAIRRECAEKAEAWFYSTVGGASTIAIERHLIDLRLRQISTLRAAILSTEPKATAEEALHKSNERAYAWRHEMMGDAEPAQDDDITKADLQEVIDDYRRLTKELDVALNGNNAAQSPSLCDIVSQVKAMNNPTQDDGKPEAVITMIENGDMSISWECSACKKLIDDREDIELVKTCPHCGASIGDFLYIEEAKE